ncbi:MAG: GAF domain-containing protein [Actinobacteria bacterium]|nr:GAF domain-containing protein [Actinomycetota bacterium]
MEHRAGVPESGFRGAPVEDVRRAESALDELLADDLLRIKRVLHVDTVAVLLVDEHEEELVARAASGLEEEVELGVRIPIGKGFAGRVAASRAAVVIEDVDHADLLNPLLREKGIRSLLGVPLEIGDKLLGVLHIGSLTPRSFGDSDIAVLRRVARRVAIPVEQAFLYGTERGARVQLEAARAHLAFLAEASAVLGSSLDYETTLASVARLAVPELADWCVIDVVDDGGSVRRVASVCANPAHDSLAKELGHSYPARPERMEGTSKVLRSGRSELVEEITPDWLNAIAPDERQREILSAIGLRSNLLVPLIARGRTLGVLTLATAESARTYGEGDLRLAEELAARAALAVDNARLFREAEESLGLLDALFATAPVGLAFYDRELRYLKVNETLASVNGVPPEDHIGRTASEVIPNLAGEVEGQLRKVLGSGEPSLGLELQGEAPSTGEERIWLTSYYPVRTAEGETIGVGVVVTDITERTRAAMRLSAQYEVTRILSAAPSFDEVSEELLAAMCKNLGWAVGGVWAADRDSGTMRMIRAYLAEDSPAAPFIELSREFRFAPGAGLPGRAWERADVEWVADYAGDPTFPRSEMAQTVGLRSGFAFPIVLGPSVFGVIELFSTERREPDHELIEMTSALGSQIGQFIERTRAEHATERARERLAFLAEASRLLASSLEYDATLQRIAELAVPKVADWCAVSILDAEGKLEQVAIAHVDPSKVRWARELNERYPPDPDSTEGTYAVLRSGEPVLMPLIPSELLERSAVDEEHLRIIQELEARSYIAAPLIAHDQAFGVIAFLTTAESNRIYDEEDLSLAEDLARRAAVAVENAQLFRRAVENEEQQRFLAEAGSALASSLDYHDTLQRVAQLAVPAFADWCIVDVLEGDEIHRLAVAAAREESQLALDELRVSYPPTLDSPQPAAQALRERRPVIYFDFTAETLKATTRDGRHHELIELLEPCSAMALPLLARGHVVGAVTFARAESGRRYTDADLPLAEEIARRSGLAVDNARLHRETEERARASLVLSHVGDGVFMVDRDGVVRLWNPAAEAITGLDVQDVVGRRADVALPGWAELAARIPVAAEPAPAARRAETLPVEVRGRELWLSITGVGLAEGTVYAFRDLTEERALEKMRSDFVATISHELRTPLASVYGAAVTLIERAETLGPDHRSRLLGVIASEADRLARIVNDVLLASRLDSQQLAFQIESCDPGEALQQTIEAARAHLPLHIEIEVAKSSEPAAVAADAERLRQILGNLIENAVKYSPDGGVIRVGYERLGSRLRFSVADQGIGIPPEERERIFEKFYRLDPALIRGVGGTGLGLYISRELVGRMQGAIWADSTQGKGSTFYVELPLADGAAQTPGRLRSRPGGVLIDQ